MKNGHENHSTHLHSPFAGIRWVLLPLNGQGTHGTRPWLMVEVWKDHEVVSDANKVMMGFLAMLSGRRTHLAGGPIIENKTTAKQRYNMSKLK